MLNQAWVAALLLIIGSVQAEEDIHFVCKYQNDIIDCSFSQLSVHPKLNDLANTTRKVLFDQNAILIVRVMEPSTSISNLSFRHNLITRIEDRAFIGLENLTYLDLGHNQLTSEELRPIIFKGPDKPNSVGYLHLKTLDLSSNALHTIHQDLFEFLPDIEELYLASNPFRVLDHGTLTALSSIHRIKILDLSSTQLSDVPSGWLNAAKNLEVLNLSLNYLKNVPKSLEETRGLRHLILDGNPIIRLTYFPKLSALQKLDLNWMNELTVVKEHSLYNLSSLKELSIANNRNLYEISEDALVEPGYYDVEKQIEIGSVFPPIEKLDLSNNKLQYLENELIGRWDKIRVLKLEANPWVCDCKNQWMVSTLVKLMSDTNNGAPNTLICKFPVEMKGKSMVELSMRNYHMRCLDLYGNEPDKDAEVLVIVLVVILVAIPISLLVVYMLKRKPGRTGFSSAYYRRANGFDSLY